MSYGQLVWGALTDGVAQPRPRRVSRKAKGQRTSKEAGRCCGWKTPTGPPRGPHTVRRTAFPKLGAAHLTCCGRTGLDRARHPALAAEAGRRPRETHTDRSHPMGFTGLPDL